MPLQNGNEILLVDANTLELVDVNTIKLFEVILPEDFEANQQSTILGGNDIKKIARTAKTGTVGGRGGILSK